MPSFAQRRRSCGNSTISPKPIQTNSKGEVLLTALQRGFEAARTVRMENGTGALQQKAIIFTESRRTQEYLFNLLQKTEFAGKVVLFNGTNTDPLSQAIYQRLDEAARRHRPHHRLAHRRQTRRPGRVLPRRSQHHDCHRSRG